VTYLNPVRLHFAGQFQADPSTVNNEIRHFDSASFQPGWQQLQTTQANPNGWWNPDGSGSFRLVGCVVTAVSYLDAKGDVVTTDPIVGMQVMGANARVAGKLVDLDPQQQMVSQIWGLQVRLTNGTSDLFSGPFLPAAFTDLWGRAQGGGNDNGAGAFWQSVISPVTWGDVSGSLMLQALQAAAPDGLLSIKFNVDSYNLNYGSPGFTLGRCVGTIGPSSLSEPQHFVLGRQLLPKLTQGAANAGPMYFMQCIVDGSTLYADFGNALPTATPGSDLAPIGTVVIGYVDAASTFQQLATLDANYSSAGWYEKTAGVQAYALTSDQLTAIASSRLAVSVGGQVTLLENLDGLHARADNFVCRVNANHTAQVTVWGSQYGVATQGIAISVAADPSQLQGGTPYPNDPLTQNIPLPDPAQPDILTFPASLLTGANGQVTLSIAAGNPNTPRIYMDGQVYGVRPMPQGVLNEAGGNPPPLLNGNATEGYGFNPWDFVSLLVWDEYDQPATWANVAPILAQYAVLYPVMDQLIDLTSETEVNRQAALLLLAFGLPVTDPNSMPVTRDLSDSKRAMLLQYLGKQVSTSPSPAAVGAAPHGKPVVIAKPGAAAAPPPPDAGAASAADGVSTKDSKTLAMRNRIGNRNK
jgi:hypothetical protein